MPVKRVRVLRPSAREAIKQILALADAAQIPLIAPAITMARKFIEILDVSASHKLPVISD